MVGWVEYTKLSVLDYIFMKEKYKIRLKGSHSRKRKWRFLSIFESIRGLWKDKHTQCKSKVKDLQIFKKSTYESQSQSQKDNLKATIMGH